MSLLVYLPPVVALALLVGLVVGHQRWLRRQGHRYERLRGDHEPGSRDSDSDDIDWSELDPRRLFK